MVRRSTTLNGIDSIMYNGELSQVQTFTNTAYANIYGVSFLFDLELTSNLHLKQNLTLMTGEDSDNMPVRHVSPVFGTTGLEFRFTNLNSELFARYNAKLPYNRLADSERDKVFYATDSNGNNYSPAWWTLNYKIMYKFNKYFAVTAGIENIFDCIYRPYSSGVVAPGRKFTVSLQAGF
jgi:hemoglobin/transferrin/lactoferrin receptor protein